ncbi:uncharacterized protein LOC109419083 [Aedes albopictus]|uniref:Ig-like domain-containing protein n=1 Tax=Aedes albopictus TaxID=7160 RepID=A0ABM1ZV42_AEDAL
MARRRNFRNDGCNCCCNQRQLLAVIVFFTIALGAPHSDPSSLTDNYLAPAMSQAYFATRNNTKVTAQKGGTALLPCTVLTQTSALVSWVRRRDFQLLTVGLSTYSSDERFLVHHIRHMGHWALRIKAVRDEDQGLYECQLSVHPVQSVFVELQVVDAVADIVGAPDLHIDEGSTLRLECKLERATEYPDYVFWYHQHSMVNFDQQNGFSVTPFQPVVNNTASPDELAADQPYPMPMDQNHHGHGHHHQHHNPQHHLHHQHHHHHHHHRHHPQHRLPPQDPTPLDGDNDDDDASNFGGWNVLDLLNPAAVASGSMNLLDAPPLLDSGELLATDLTAGFSAVEEQLHQWALNQSGFLPYSHILQPATSVLTIKEVHSKHAGNYTCAPSNTRPASITVHVLQGEKPAAMQHANRSQLEDSKAKGGSSSSSSSPARTLCNLRHPLLVLPVTTMLVLLLAQIRCLSSLLGRNQGHHNHHLASR